jgi:hypothetical protein
MRRVPQRRRDAAIDGVDNEPRALENVTTNSQSRRFRFDDE